MKDSGRIDQLFCYIITMKIRQAVQEFFPVWNKQKYLLLTAFVSEFRNIGAIKT